MVGLETHPMQQTMEPLNLVRLQRKRYTIFDKNERKCNTCGPDIVKRTLSFVPFKMIEQSPVPVEEGQIRGFQGLPLRLQCELQLKINTLQDDITIQEQCQNKGEILEVYLQQMGAQEGPQLWNHQKHPKQEDDRAQMQKAHRLLKDLKLPGRDPQDVQPQGKDPHKH
jgi:hypothetical protein